MLFHKFRLNLKDNCTGEARYTYNNEYLLFKVAQELKEMKTKMAESKMFEQFQGSIEKLEEYMQSVAPSATPQDQLDDLVEVCILYYFSH